ncbi:heterokaryon incompatibility protein-domain-containing protein, partial [Dendryphion nanum]
MTDKDTIPFRGIYNDPGCYRPLNYHSKEIRYLEVAPGYGKEPLLCTLGYTSLVDDVAPFEALSYTWGDISTTVMLNLRYLDEHSRQQSEYQTQHYKITPNLQGALLRLRYEDQPRKIWVDAVCINQVDDTERTEQVQIMGLVYSIAQRVLVWLGEEDLSSN